MLRINNMVLKAMKHDPRLQRRKIAEKEAKEAEQRKKEETAAREARETAEKEAAAKEQAVASKAEREKAKKKASAARNSCRKLLRSITAMRGEEAQGEFGSIDAEELESTLAKLSIEDVTALIDSMGGEAAVKVINPCTYPRFSFSPLSPTF